MKRIFNKRFWMYFFITFIVSHLLIFFYILFVYTPDYYPAPIKVCLNIALTGTLISLSSALSMATAISSFVSFRYANINGRSDFFRLFATAAACFFALSIGLYAYDSAVSPRLNVQSMSLLWQLKTGEFRPAPIEKEETSSFSNPDFENISPMTFSYGKLQFKIDSLKGEVQRHKLESEKLLNSLPKEMADEAYESYQFGLLDVEYGYSQTPSANTDSVRYVQQYPLHNEADLLFNSKVDLLRYQLEKYKRGISAGCLFLSFVIFSLLGYYSRNKLMNRIFGIVAIIITAAFMLYSISQYTQSMMRERLREVRSIQSNGRF